MGVLEGTLVPQRAAAQDAAGRAEARFAELVERQARFVFRVAFAVTRNSHDAEDVVQETFLKLYRTGSWERMEQERAFLARAAWRIAVSKRSRHAQEEPGPELRAAGSSPEEQAIRESRDAALHRLIDALPAVLRLPLVLSAIEGLTSAEIGRVMGIPEGTVRTRILRARQVLKEKLTGGGYGK